MTLTITRSDGEVIAFTDWTSFEVEHGVLTIRTMHGTIGAGTRWRYLLSDLSHWGIDRGTK